MSDPMANPPAFAIALDDCLDQIAAGTSPDVAVARYPQWSAELAPRVAVAERLRRWPLPSPPAAERAAFQRRLEALEVSPHGGRGSAGSPVGGSARGSGDAWPPSNGHRARRQPWSNWTNRPRMDLDRLIGGMAAIGVAPDRPCGPGARRMELAVAAAVVICMAVFVSLWPAQSTWDRERLARFAPWAGTAADGGRPWITIAANEDRVWGRVGPERYCSGDYRIALYAATDAWYVQPTPGAASDIRIQPDCTWAATTYEWQALAAHLVMAGYKFPDVIASTAADCPPLLPAASGPVWAAICYP